MGLPELLILGGIALLIFGPKRLPELAKSLGKGIRDFKKAMDGQYEEEEKKTELPPGQKQTPISDASKAKTPDRS